MDEIAVQSVGGESIDDLARVFARIEKPKIRNGQARIQLKAPPDVLAPLLRAIMRVEAELLLRDADVLDSSAQERRTAEHRRMDALVVLAMRYGVARGTVTPEEAEAAIARVMATE